MMNVSGSEILMAILPVLLAVLLLVRLVLARTSSGKKPMTAEEKGWGTAQTGGSREIQADRVEVIKTGAGVLGILADGIGRENTGRVCAQIALDAAADAYEPYQVLTNPEYLFRTVCREANVRIQKTIGAAPVWDWYSWETAISTTAWWEISGLRFSGAGS